MDDTSSEGYNQFGRRDQWDRNDAYPNAPPAPAQSNPPTTTHVNVKDELPIPSISISFDPTFVEPTSTDKPEGGSTSTVEPLAKKEMNAGDGIGSDGSRTGGWSDAEEGEVVKSAYQYQHQGRGKV
ncbi:hypothetical protein JAAARDRAFT_66407 [Jaapia argillacea MUCL 33604]|uniref:Uncharacterized protein n=1 Tax=Jaapia argillacea MUCL 33604 TaxID=933084 RepID=A0A067Q9B0_9AGAM|nr:hypothetical protein JAAARDRAFT_66407 [Jaapia argillacea MUCL 33604]